MPNDLVTDLQNLRNLTNTNRSNRAVTEPLVSNDQEVDWQLVASYLDSEMFSFILKNRDNQTIKEFGLQLSSNLANKFGLTR
jgi:hypothetical protein|tara:strand:+ start:290 stop:535 length:246 start_codon:yes stop_codon:yes gene_type:complete